MSGSAAASLHGPENIYFHQNHCLLAMTKSTNRIFKSAKICKEIGPRSGLRVPTIAKHRNLFLFQVSVNMNESWITIQAFQYRPSLLSTINVHLSTPQMSYPPHMLQRSQSRLAYFIVSVAQVGLCLMETLASGARNAPHMTASLGNRFPILLPSDTLFIPPKQ